MVDQAAIDTFLYQLTLAKATQMQREFPSLPAPSFRADTGKKFIRIVKVDNQESAFCFIDRASGDILKCAGWSARAKGARGHISNGAADLTPYGASYKNAASYQTFRDMGIA